MKASSTNLLVGIKEAFIIYQKTYEQFFDLNPGKNTIGTKTLFGKVSHLSMCLKSQVLWLSLGPVLGHTWRLLHQLVGAIKEAFNHTLIGIGTSINHKERLRSFKA